jgi:hypothetical protein
LVDEDLTSYAEADRLYNAAHRSRPKQTMISRNVACYPQYAPTVRDLFSTSPNEIIVALILQTEPANNTSGR